MGLLSAFVLFAMALRPPAPEGAELKSTTSAETKLSTTPEDVADWRKIDADFANPPAEFRLIQFSAHDGALLPVDKMAEAGIGGIELFMQSDGYLKSDEAWENVRKNIEAAKKAGLRVWMADDNGYPSGTAGGLVVEADPALEARCLMEVTKDGEGTGAVSLQLPAGAEKFVHAFLYPLVDGRPVLDRAEWVPVQPDRVEAAGREGSWRLCAFAVAVMYEGNSAKQLGVVSGFKTTGRHPNLLQPAATRKFLDLTHEEYARRFDPLAEHVDVFITNEPLLQSQWYEHQPLPARPGGLVFIPWDEDLPRRFRQDHGYDLLPRLPALYGGDGADSRLTRRHFYQTVGNVQAENFTARIGAWADQNGVRSAGHPVLEEVMIHHVIGYGDFFRFVEPMQIPTCDVPMPDPGAPWVFWHPKFLSSVAQAKNRDTVACLLDPIIDRPVMNLTPSPEQFRRIVNMAVFCGANQFQTYLRWADYDPAVYRGMSEYAGRLAAVLRGARSAATVAMYYPIETFQAEFLPAAGFVMTHDKTWYPPHWDRMQKMRESYDTIAKSLTTMGIDFNWLHGDWIREARVENGILVAAGGRYSTLVMPQVEVLPLDVAEKIAEFQKSGGKVLWVNSLPELGDAPGEHAQVIELFAGQNTISPGNVAAAIGRVIPPGFELRTNDVPMIARFVRDGRRINFLVNYRDKPMAVPLKSAGGPLTLQVYDTLDGSITAQQAPASVTIAPQSSLMVVEDPS
jgi:hypothetical protein